MFLSRYLSIGIIMLTIPLTLSAMDTNSKPKNRSHILTSLPSLTKRHRKKALRENICKLIFKGQKATNAQLKQVYQNEKTILEEAFGLVSKNQEITVDLVNRFNNEEAKINDIATIEALKTKFFRFVPVENQQQSQQNT